MYRKFIVFLLYFSLLTLFSLQLSCSSCFDSTADPEDVVDDFLPDCKYAHCDARDPRYLSPPGIVIDPEPNGGKYPINISLSMQVDLGYENINCENEFGSSDYGYITKLEWRILPDPWSGENSITYAPSILDANSGPVNHLIDYHFEEPGEYQFEVRATDDCGNQSTNQKLVSISDNVCPSFRIECTDCYGYAPLEPIIKVFTSAYGSEYDSDDTIIYWEMDFNGDGVPDIGPFEKEDDGAFLHSMDLVYQCVGVHEISVTLEDPYHCRVTGTIEALAAVRTGQGEIYYNPDDTPSAVATYKDSDGDRYVYLAEGVSGVRVFDVTEDTIEPRYVGKTPFFTKTDYFAGSQYADMQVAEFDGINYLFAAGHPFFAVYNLSNPENPVLMFENIFSYFGCEGGGDARYGDRICMPPPGDSNHGYAYVTDSENKNLYGIFVNGTSFNWTDIESHFILSLIQWGWNGENNYSTCIHGEATGMGYYNRRAAGDICPFTWPPSNGCCRECGLITLGNCGLAIVDLSRPEKIGHPEGNGGGNTPWEYRCLEEDNPRSPSIWSNKAALYYKPGNVRKTYFADVKVVDHFAFVLNSLSTENSILIYDVNDIWDYGKDFLGMTPNYTHATTAPVAVVNLTDSGNAEKLLVKDKRAEGGSVTMLVQFEYANNGFQEVDVSDFLASDGVAAPVVTRSYFAGEYVGDIDGLDNYVYMAENYGLKTYNDELSPAVGYFRTSGDLDRVNYFDNKLFIHKQKAGIEVYSAIQGITHKPVTFIKTFGEAYDSQEVTYSVPTTTEMVKLLAVQNNEFEDPGEQANLQVFDVANIYAPFEITYSIGQVEDMASWRNILAVCINGQIKIYRFSLSETPVVEEEITIIPDVLFVYDGVGITDGLLVAMDSGKQIATYTFDPNAASLAFERVGTLSPVVPKKIALDGDQLFYLTSIGITVIDLSDPAVVLPGKSIIINDVLETAGDPPNDLYVRDGVVMVACGDRGLLVFQNCDGSTFALVGDEGGPMVDAAQIDGNFFESESGGLSYFNIYYINRLMYVLDFFRVGSSVLCGQCSE
jgi:hypothetical protein